MSLLTNYRLILAVSVIALTLGVWFFRYQTSFLTQNTVSNSSFESVLLEEPKRKNGFTYFHLGDSLVQTHVYTDFHYGDVLRIYGQADSDKILRYPKIEKVGENYGNPFYESILNLRRHLLVIFNNLLPEPHSALVSGIVLGGQEELPEGFLDNLRRSGTIHVVVVSGYNIAVVAGFVMNLAGFIRRRYAILLTFTVILLYTFLTGAEPPTVRAAIMGSIAYLALLLGRFNVSVYVLFLTGSIMLLWDPKLVWNISFQLSFMATLGIITLTKALDKTFIRWLPSPFRENLTTTLSAQLLVTPVVFYHFGQISLIAPLINTLILWLIPLITLGGFVLLGLGILIFPLAKIIATLLWLPLTVFIWVVNYGGSLVFSSVGVPQRSWWLVGGYYLMLLSLLLWMKSRGLRKN
jgi:competence protein ComEC